MIAEDNTHFYAEIYKTVNPNNKYRLLFESMPTSYKSEIINFHRSVQIKMSLDNSIKQLKTWLEQFENPVLLYKRSDNKMFKHILKDILELEEEFKIGKFKRTKTQLNSLDMAIELKNKYILDIQLGEINMKLIIWLAFVAICYIIADNKNRNKVMWSIAGALFGIFAVIVLLFLKTLPPDKN